MSLKTALQADLAAKGMKLGDLADKLGITQQSVSKWIAKDEIPKDRLVEVLNLVSPGVHLSKFMIDQMQLKLLSNKMAEAAAVSTAGRHARTPPQPGDEDDQPQQFTWVDAAHVTHVPFEPPAVVQARARRAARAKWASSLSETSRPYVQGAMDINEAPREFDYLSPKLAILVRAMPLLDATRLISIAVPLMLLKQVRPSVQCWLVLLPRHELGVPESSVRMDEAAKRFHARRLVTVKLDLEMLGVKVIELPAAEELSPRIEAVENPEKVFANPPFSYEDFPEEA